MVGQAAGRVSQPQTTHKITLLGQAMSGKTNLLAALLNQQSCWADLEYGDAPLRNAAFKPRYASGSDEETAIDHLRAHYDAMLKGRESAQAATNAARAYKVSLSWDDPPAAAPERTSFFGRLSGAARGRPAGPGEIRFEIVDGRGADAAPSEIISADDKDAQQRRAVYRQAMDDSAGFVIFMPLMSDDEGSEAIISARFLGEIHEALDRKAANDALPRLRYVALCFTKCERAFAACGVDAEYEAGAPDKYRELLADNAVLETFKSLLAQSGRANGFELRIFPVSTYGFVHAVGSANFYPWPAAPGLLTRAVDEFDDYSNLDIPDYRDHFPFPVADDQAKSLWRPFNIAPPLVYALTGRVTGPISIPAADALAFAMA